MLLCMSANSSSGVKLSDLLSPATIELQMRASQRDDALLELVAKVPELKDRLEARELLFRALLEREQLHSTGIGDGLALPHARNVMPDLIKNPVIVFGRHPSGIPYDSIDGRPAQLFFLLVATSVSQHLFILARISRILRQPNVRKELSAATQPEQIIAALRQAEANLP